MLIRNLIWKRFIAVMVIVGIQFVPANFVSNLEPTNQNHSGSIRLEYPPFLNIAYAAEDCQLNRSDIEEIEAEAGMAAYAKLAQSINLKEIDPLVVKTPRKRTNTVLSGLMFIPGYDEIPGEQSEAMIYVHSCGWIIAYLPKGRPTAQLIDMKNYEEDRLSQTTLEQIIRQIIRGANGESSSIQDESVVAGFFHFAYPDATGLALAVSNVNYSKPSEEFQVTVPNSFSILESSIAGVRYDLANGYDQSTCTLDSNVVFTQVAEDNQWGVFEYQKLSEFRTKVSHKFELKLVQYVGNSGRDLKYYCGMALLYKEASE